MEMRPILLTGATGQVGSALLPRLRQSGPVVAPSRAEMDLANAASVRAMIRSVRPRWIVNPGAYTAVDRAETDRAAAWAVNAEAPGVMGAEAQAMGVPVIHVSTDYVFSGEGTAAWRETDATGPVNEYGRSKLAGEQALEQSGAAHLTLRTSWVYAASGQNFLRTMLRLGREREELRVVGDQHGTPTSAADLADVIVWLMHRFEATDAEAGVHRTLPRTDLVTGAYDIDAVTERLRRDGGLLHVAGAGESTTWFGFAEAIFEEFAAQQTDARVPRLTPLTSAEYPTPARRPVNSRLDCSLLETRFGYKMPEWRTSLRRILREVIEADRAPAIATR